MICMTKSRITNMPRSTRTKTIKYNDFFLRSSSSWGFVMLGFIGFLQAVYKDNHQGTYQTGEHRACCKRNKFGPCQVQVQGDNQRTDSKYIDNHGKDELGIDVLQVYDTLEEIDDKIGTQVDHGDKARPGARKCLED